jgi:predicted DNA binding CopG/RHH family protein
MPKETRDKKKSNVRPLRRDEAVKVLVTGEELSKLKSAATRDGLPVSTWVRLIALRATTAAALR